MAEMSAFVTGLPEVTANLLIAFAELEKQSLAATQVSAARIYNGAENAVAIDTGKLERSGTIRQFREGSVQGYEVAYGKRLRRTAKTYNYPEGDANSYAWFVELGTVKMAARPFLFPAFANEVPIWLDALHAL